MIEGPLTIAAGVWDVDIPAGGYIDVEVYEKDGSVESLDITEEMLTSMLMGCSPVNDIFEAEQSNENGVNFLSIDIDDSVVVRINSEVVSTSFLAYSLGDFIVNAVILEFGKLSVL